MTSTFRCAIVIPCHNEAQRLRVDTFHRFLAAHPEVRLLFVDDGSSDGTARVLKGFKVLRLRQNRGKAGTVRAGVLHLLQAETPPDVIGFWCLTPRVPLAYLLPALPTTAWWIARRPIQAVRFWPIAAALITLAVVTLGQTFARLNPHKFPRAFYASLPEEAILSFQGSAPYSAEFYLGSRVRRDGTGDLLTRREGRHYIARPNTPAKAPGRSSSEGTTGTPAAESRSGV